MNIEAGTRIGRYKIQSRLGAGGMGEVYLATDTQLDREVALKILSAEVATDGQRLQRFLQEARAASKLKGEHAAHIYDVSEADNTYYIAMEYVEGQPLDKLIASHRLDVRETVRLGVQIAEALEEAHARGITHRDIKPANIIVTPRGSVKVLDFGLAKLGEGATASSDMEAATNVMTSPGLVMGTVAYMSPEQALGEVDVDHRTDIYSLGVVLYEMTTGHVPFVADSVSKTIDKIVHEPPEAMARFNYDVPAELDVIVRKALRKKRDERYQYVHDMLVDLRSLQEDSGYNIQHRSFAPHTSSGQSSGQTHSVTSGEQATLLMQREPQTRTTAEAGAKTRSDAERKIEEKPETTHRRSKVFVPLLILAIALVVAGSYVLYRYAFRQSSNQSRPSLASLQDMKIMKLPMSGLTATAVISPDGKFIARVVYEGGKMSLRLRQVNSTSEKEIVPAFDGRIYAVTFAHDGNSVYYVMQTDPGVLPELRRISILGGDPQKIISNVASRVTLSPDGRRLAFVRNLPQTKEQAIIIANEDGSGEQQLMVRKTPVDIHDVAWSPDGKVIAYVVMGTDKDGYYTNVEGVTVADKATQPISLARWRNIGSINWLSDSSALVITARDRASLPSTPEQLWLVSYPDGTAQRITNDTNYYVMASLTSDSRTLLAALHGTSSQIWLAPGGDSARARAITTNGSDMPSEVSWAADGRIIYDSQASGNYDIWVMNADGSGAKQLTFDPLTDMYPSPTSDARYVVFITNRSVGWSLWRVNMDGSNARELVRNIDQRAPVCSPDGAWVYYKALDESSQHVIWKIPIDGGAPVRVLNKNLEAIDISRDGKLIAGFYKDEESNAAPQILVFPIEGGDEPLYSLNVPKDFDAPLHWSPDGQAVDFIVTREGKSNVERLPLAGGAFAKQLTNWQSDWVKWFNWSRDGKQLAVVRGTDTTELLLIQNFK